MGRVLLILVLNLISFSILAETDLSGLYRRVNEPTVEGIKKEFAKFKELMGDLDLKEHQLLALERLENSMLEVSLPATLKRKKSKGPSWRDLAIEYLEEEYSIDHIVSYTDEGGGASEGCGFGAVDELELGEYFYKWDSVKPIRGSQKSVAYFVMLIVPIRGPDMDTGRMKWCNHTRREFAFEAKLDAGSPVEIDYD